jgi:hypothetical protein
MSMKAEDLPEIFILFFPHMEDPKKFTYFGGGIWNVVFLDEFHTWQKYDSVPYETVLSAWERSNEKFQIIWPEEYGE